MSATVGERAGALAQIESSESLRSDERVRVELIAALDLANEEYFASWNDGESEYSEGQGELRLALLDAVIALEDDRAIPVLVDAVDTGNDAHQALAAFGDAAVSHVLDAYVNAPFAKASSHLGLQQFMLLNTMNFMIENGQLGGTNRERIARVAWDLLTVPQEGPNIGWTLMGGMDLAMTLGEPALMNRVAAISENAGGLRHFGIASSDELTRVQQYAGRAIALRETVGSEDGFQPVTDAMLQDPAPEDWPMWRRTLDGWGYSPLDQIDRGTSGNSGWSGRAASDPGCSRGLRSSTMASCTCRIRGTSSRP